MAFLVISSSLGEDSKTLVLANSALKTLRKLGKKAELLDLRDYRLPQCDGDKAYENEKVKRVHRKIAGAKGILLATPVYNFYSNATAKNLVELTGKAWLNKPVGFLCSAGGPHSYMSILSLANSLMLDFRCFIVPRFVYATGEAFEGSEIVNQDVSKRISELASTLVKLAKALR